jgi:hypothetical protein
MHFIALFPGILAAYVAYAKSPAKAFLYVYLPTLMFLPDYYRWMLAGLPDPTFNEAAILPIAVVYFWKREDKWTYTFTDLLVLVYFLCVSLSEYLANGYSDAQNLFFDNLCLVVLPYALAKGIIERHGLRVEFAKCLITILGIVVLTQAYEFRFLANPFRTFLDPLFPGDMGRGWITTERYGFGRASGPYGHAILAGVILAAGFHIQRWLERGGYWGSQVKARMMTLTLIAGSAMTLSRGPWLGAALGGVVTMIGYAKNRARALKIALAVALIVGIPAYLAFQSYVSVGRSGAETPTQETAAYRKELIDKYMGIAMERMYLGWGLSTWPQVPGMPSIDNHYLILALMHGFLAVGLFVGIILTVGGRLAVFWARSSLESESGRLGVTLLAALTAIVFSIATVFMGLQVKPLLFLLCGWAESISRVEEEEAERELPAESYPFRFKRVLT